MRARASLGTRKIEYKVVFRVSDQCLKERFLCGQDLTLAKFVDICRATESTPSGGRSSPSDGRGSASGGRGGHNSNKSARGASI